jgi:hypothetical protein
MNVLPGVPFVESPLFRQWIASAGLDAETQRVATSLHTHGYAVLRFPEPDFDAVAERIKDSLRPRFDLAAWRKQPPSVPGRVTRSSGPRTCCTAERRIATCSELDGARSRTTTSRGAPTTRR